MKNTFRTTSFTPSIKISNNGLVAVGGNNICYITNPSTGFITNFDMPPNQDIMDVGENSSSNLVFVVPSNETKNTIHTVTSMCWNKGLEEREGLLVCWNCHSLVLYNEKTEKTTPSELWGISINISDTINSYFSDIWGGSVEDKVSNEEYVSRKYSLFIVDAQFTENNDIAVLTGNTFMLIKRPYDTIISIELKMYSKSFFTFQESNQTYFLIGRIDGCLDLLRLDGDTFRFVKTGLMNKDFCIPVSVIVHNDKLFVVKSTKLEIFDLHSFNILSTIEIGLCIACCYNDDTSLLSQDYQYNIKKINFITKQISVIANNIVSFDLTNKGSIYALMPLQSSASRSVFPIHLLVIYKKDQAEDETQEIEATNCLDVPLPVLWKEYKSYLTSYSTDDVDLRSESLKELYRLQIEITANVLVHWLFYLQQNNIHFDSLPEIVQEFIQRYFCCVGSFELPPWALQYKGPYEYKCPLCQQPCIIKNNQILCPLNHTFKLCVATKQPVVQVSRSWKCMRCNNYSILPLLSSSEQQLLKPFLDFVHCTPTTCIYCGSLVKNLLYI